MMVAYEKVLHLGGDDEKPMLFVGTNGVSFMLSLQTSDFYVSYDSGKASITLTRDLSVEQCSEMARSLLEAVEKTKGNVVTYAYAYIES